MSSQVIGLTESLILLVFLIMAIISFQLFRAKSGILLSNRILGVLFSLLSIQILISYLTVIRVLEKPLFILIDDTLLLGVGPLLLLYTKITIGSRKKLDMSDLIHFVPLIFSFVPFMFFLIMPSNYSEWLLGFDLSERIKTLSRAKFQWTSFLMLTHINVYLLSSFFYAKRLQNHNTEANNYKWIIYTLGAFQIINIASYIQIFRPFLFLKHYPSLSFLFILITLLIFLISILLKGMEGSPLFSELTLTKYQNSKLGNEEKVKLHLSLQKLIEEDKIYLNSAITVKTLAEKLMTHPKNVSQVINEGFGKSFYDLMNHYRVVYAKELLSDSSKKTLTIAEIQYASGFGSKSSFHTQFKKRTKLSPKEFRLLMQKDLQ